MRTIGKLFKLQIDEVYDFFKNKNLKKWFFSVGKYLMLLLIITVAAYFLLQRIAMLGFTINAQLMSIVLLVTQGISLIFATGNILTNLYMNKNNEFLLALPASPNQIFISKIMVIYVREVIINTLYTLPLLLALGILGGLGGYYFIICIVLMLFLPLLPMGIGALISIPIMYLLRFFKKHPMISIVAIMGTALACIILYVNVLSFFATSFNITSKLIETVRGINKSILSFGDGNWLFLKLSLAIINIKQLAWCLVYIAIGLALFIGTLFLIKPFYLKMAIGSGENTTPITVRPRKFKDLSPMKSLIKKEFLTVFRSPGYVFQYFLFAILMPIIVVLYDKLLLMLVVNSAGRMMIAGSHLLIVAILAMLSNIISASTISREGGSFYIMKTSPVNYYVQTGAKLIFNLIFTITAIIITGIVSFFYLSPMVVIFTTLTVLFAAIGHMCLSFDLDLKKPTLTWYDANEINNMNSNTTKSILWGLFLAVFMGMFLIFFASAKYQIIPWIILLLLSMAFCVYRLYILILRVFYQYDRLEM